MSYQSLFARSDLRFKIQFNSSGGYTIFGIKCHLIQTIKNVEIHDFNMRDRTKRIIITLLSCRQYNTVTLYLEDLFFFLKLLSWQDSRQSYNA